MSKFHYIVPALLGCLAMGQAVAYDGYDDLYDVSYEEEYEEGLGDVVMDDHPLFALLADDEEEYGEGSLLECAIQNPYLQFEGVCISTPTPHGVYLNNAQSEDGRFNGMVGTIYLYRNEMHADDQMGVSLMDLDLHDTYSFSWDNEYCMQSYSGVICLR